MVESEVQAPSAAAAEQECMKELEPCLDAEWLLYDVDILAVFFADHGLGLVCGSALYSLAIMSYDPQHNSVLICKHWYQPCPLF